MTSKKAPRKALSAAAKPVTTVHGVGDIPHQVAHWYPPHRGRGSNLVVNPLCVFCLGGHRHVVENTRAKTVTKACPVTGSAYVLDVPRAVRRAA